MQSTRLDSTRTNNAIPSPEGVRAPTDPRQSVREFYGSLKNDRLYRGIPMLCVEGLHELVAERTRAHLGNGRGRVLDIGCGQGALALRMTDLGYDVHGVDEVDACRCKDAIAFHHGRAEEFIVDAKYDAVLFIEVAEHLENPWAVLETAWNGLRPGGILCFSTPNVDSMFSRAWFLLTGRHWYFEDQNLREDGHQTPIHDFQVRFHLQRIGFELLERVAPIDRRVAVGPAFRAVLAIARRYAALKNLQTTEGPVSLYVARKPG